MGKPVWQLGPGTYFAVPIDPAFPFPMGLTNHVRFLNVRHIWGDNQSRAVVSHAQSQYVGKETMILFGSDMNYVRFDSSH